MAQSVFCLNETWNQDDFENLNVFLGNIDNISDHIAFIVFMPTIIKTICLWDRKRNIQEKMEKNPQRESFKKSSK